MPEGYEIRLSSVSKKLLFLAQLRREEDSFLVLSWFVGVQQVLNLQGNYLISSGRVIKKVTCIILTSLSRYHKILSDVESE